MDVGLVCDACSALTPIGVPQCTRCGASVALDPRPRAKSKPPPAGRACGKCGLSVGGSQKFCPNCGAKLPFGPVGGFEGPGIETRVGPRPSGAQPVQQDAKDKKEKPGRSTLFF